METLREARVRYFEENGFARDGGYGSAWVDNFKVGPIPLPFPNTPARIRAVRLHDLHHVLTGYRTDFTGELEMGAWEIGAGCKGYGGAWFLNLLAMGTGWLLAPRRVFRAFVHGMNCETLYQFSSDEPVLEQTVQGTRAQLHIEEGRAAKPTLREVTHFIAASLTGLALGILVLAFALTPVSIAAWTISYLVWKRSQVTMSAQTAAPAKE